MVEDLFAKLSGERILSKLDIHQAYQQICFYEASKKLVTKNTCTERMFRYTWLPFGVSFTPGIFQLVIEEVLQGVPNVVVYLDEIIAYSNLKDSM